MVEILEEEEVDNEEDGDNVQEEDLHKKTIIVEEELV